MRGWAAHPSVNSAVEQCPDDWNQMHPQRSDCSSNVDNDPEKLVRYVEFVVLALPNPFVFHRLDEHLLHDAHQRDLQEGDCRNCQLREAQQECNQPGPAVTVPAPCDDLPRCKTTARWSLSSSRGAGQDETRRTHEVVLSRKRRGHKNRCHDESK